MAGTANNKISITIAVKIKTAINRVGANYITINATIKPNNPCRTNAFNRIKIDIIAKTIAAKN